jgi:beta-lactam-binding protein with PASTA domain
MSKLSNVVRVVAAGSAAAVAVAVLASSGSAGPRYAPTAVAAAKARVPNEVGRNHQAAQDDLQAHGFYNLREKDCSGRDRLLLWDRNWKVVRQSPRAGARVSKSHAITLCSVKYSD